MAFAFLGVQMVVFGIYMGTSFAPNHIGMDIIPAGTKMDFLNKQVRTGRNIRGGRWMTFFMGGLNHQVEHHLFPSMARPHLWKARRMVREVCAREGIPYTETTLAQAWVAGHRVHEPRRPVRRRLVRLPRRRGLPTPVALARIGGHGSIRCLHA